MRPIGIDLFAGAGGLSLGFEQAGFDIVAAVDIDPVHCAAHEFNFPKCKTLCRDVSGLSGADIREAAGFGKRQIDVVFGGAPCQGFSMIGQRALDDPRNSLVKHYVRIVRELAPKYFVFENVKGLTLGKHKTFLDEIVKALSKDYDVLLPYRVLNAAEYGVPQDRRRLFLMGARKSMKLPIYPDTKPHVTVREALADIPDAEQFADLVWNDSVRTDLRTPSKYARDLREIGNKAPHFGYRRRHDPNVLTSSMRADHSKLSRQRFAAAEWGQTEPISRFHKLDPDGVCNTLRAGTNTDHGAFTSPRPIHYLYNRCITVREAARLHSYPDWFRFHVTKWHGFRQIGNSVPPLLARAVAETIVKAMRLRPSAPKEIVALGDPKLLQMTLAQASEYYGVPSSVIAKRDRNYAKERADERRAA
ncbi:MAG: DNA cytosine methyltransferase [Proteobacteria bacterium]|nr:DNA cytosine methyltransferase [Pseudomonadota bacterium]